jgi:hypothetical protein
VEIVAVGGDRPHRVGAVHGSALDWQPLPVSGSRPCTPPSHSKVLASDPEAVAYSEAPTVFARSGTRFYGCLKALDQTRLLLKGSDSYFDSLVAVRLAGRFVALEAEYAKVGVIDTATRYDLASGKAMALALAGAGDFNQGPFTSGLDSLALDSSGFAAWRETTTVQFPEPISAISCPSPYLCVAGDQVGDILSSTNPAGGAGAWRVTATSPNLFDPEITELSCPSTSLCFGLSANALLSSTDPTGGASAWTKTPIDQGSNVTAISCPSVSLCVAVNLHGHVLTSTDPTGGANAWTIAAVELPPCASQSSQCVSEQLYARDDDGLRPVDTALLGGRKSLGKVTLDADSLVLSWTHDGAQRQLQLR